LLDSRWNPVLASGKIQRRKKVFKEQPLAE
jgi:hypothetical protein